MANIDSQISKIRSAERGEDVRDSIISALRDINNDVPADMSNPIQITGTMPAGTDLTIPINPPALVSQVYIKQAGSGGKNTTLVDAKIVENGKYPSEDKDDGGSSYDPDKEIRYYKSVDVNVPQLANKVIDLEEEITQNGTYSAPADWGADGLRTFTVNVNPAPVSGQFEVKFYGPDMTTVIETQLVPAYGSASCTKLDGTTDSGGKNFKGWNPSPTNITRDMKCYPVYGEYIIDPGEIQETWEQICADGGAHVPIGGYKSLVLNVYANYDWNDPLAIVKFCSSESWYTKYDTKITAASNNQVIFSYPYYMVKVAEGEDGSHSTWISTGCASLNGQFRWRNVEWSDIMDTYDVLNYYKAPFGNWPYVRDFDWETCIIRQILNGKVFSSLEPVLQNNIKQVTKYSRGLSEFNPNGIRVQKSTLDKIWIPSTKEIHTLFSTFHIGDQNYVWPNSISEIEEINGIDYASNYVPTWPDGVIPGDPFILRTEISTRQNSQLASPTICKLSSPYYYVYSSASNEKTNRFPFGFCL